jgi:hypothetical protein
MPGVPPEKNGKGGDRDMKCNRCKSLMILEKFYGNSEFFYGWHCVYCGNIEDEVILQHRREIPEVKSKRARLQGDPGLSDVPDEELSGSKASILVDLYDLSSEGAVYKECKVRGIKRTYWQNNTHERAHKPRNPMPQLVPWRRHPRSGMPETGKLTPEI